MHESTNCLLGTIPILRQQKNWMGEVMKWSFIADVQYCIYAEGGWVRKVQKYADLI